MTDYLRFTAVVLTGVLLSQVLQKQSKDLGILLTLAVCVLVCIGAMEFLEPVTELLSQIRRLGSLDSTALGILLKAAGIGLMSELASLICADAGEAALGKALQILSNAAILWLSLPLFRQILGIIEEVLVGK